MSHCEWLDRLGEGAISKDTTMTFKKGAPAPNRKLPPDDVLKADIAAGLSDRAIARKYDLWYGTVYAYANKNGWRKTEVMENAAARVEAKAAAERRYPIDTPAKVVRKIEVLFQFGNKMRSEEHFISLPRVPSITAISREHSRCRVSFSHGSRT